MLMRIAGIVPESIVDGPGFRLAVFVQGCPHNCEGCHNPESHAFDGGRMIDTAEIIKAMNDNILLDGITLTGGEPFCQPEACAELARAAHEAGLNVWAYSGWTYEQLRDQISSDVLAEIDVLVDGPYRQDLRTLGLPWRGSSNQRIIDVKRSTAEGRAKEIGGAT